MALFGCCNGRPDEVVLFVRDNGVGFRGACQDRSSGNPAVVLLDIKMPKVDGLQGLRAIKSDPAKCSGRSLMNHLKGEQTAMKSGYKCFLRTLPGRAHYCLEKESKATEPPRVSMRTPRAEQTAC